MKISKSKIRQIISESLNKILNEEDKKEETTSGAAGLQKKKTSFQTGIGAEAALKRGINKVSDEDLKANFQIWKYNNQFYLISKDDPNYETVSNTKNGAACQEFSISQDEIDAAREAIKDAQKGKKDT